MNLKRRSSPPILVQVLVLVLTTVVVSQVVTFAVILLTPAPPPAGMTLKEVQLGLQSGTAAHKFDLSRRVIDHPPFPPSLPSQILNTAAVASGLNVDPVTVRLKNLHAPPGLRGNEPSLMITDPGDGLPLRVELIDDPRRTSRHLEVADQILNSNFRGPPMEAAWLRPDGRWVYVRPATPMLSDWRVRLGLSFLLGLAAVAPLAWLAARRMTGPIRKLAFAAERGRLGEPPAFPADGPPEVVRASNALATMHERLERQFEDRMRMLLAIAHDLRTPLTALRLRLAVREDSSRPREIGLIERMETMIREILDYADAASSGPVETLDVVRLVQALMRDREASEGVVRYCGPSQLAAAVPASKLERAVSNLLDNALRYGRDVEIWLEATAVEIRITVADRGPGIAPQDRERLQEPFERGEASRNRDTGGIGLGLTIARRIAQDLGGWLNLDERPGGGLLARLSIPLETGLR